MTRDFTLKMYARILGRLDAAGYEPLTVRAYLRGRGPGGDDLPDRFVVLRHDVDRKPENAVKMAELEATYDVASTYYFRTSTFDPARCRAVEEMGHEVGYHYEDYVRAGGDADRAHETFRHNLDLFRYSVDVDTVCMHGNPLSSYDNREMWTAEGTPGFDAYGLLGEAYLSMDFADVAYFSDTGRTWRDGPLKIKDHTMGEGKKPVDADTTEDLLSALSPAEVPRACVLAHPDRWADSYPELLAQRTVDGAVNVVKRGLTLL